MRGKISAIVMVGHEAVETLDVLVARVAHGGDGRVLVAGQIDGKTVELLLSPGEAHHIGGMLIAASFTAAGSPPPVMKRSETSAILRGNS